MEITVEELLKEFNKIRKIFDFEKHEMVLSGESQEAIEFVSKNIELFEENFHVFAKQGSSIMHPDEFIQKVSLIPGGEKVLQGKLEYLIKNLKHNANRMLHELTRVEGIDEIIANDFEKFYRLYTHRSEDGQLEYTLATPETANPKFSNFGSNRADTISLFIQSMYNATNGPEVLEKNKDMIFCLENSEAIATVVTLLANDPRYNEFVQKNFEQIRDNCSEKELINLYKALQFSYPEEYSKKKFIIENMYDAGLEFLKSDRNKSNTDVGSIELAIEQACNRIISQGRAEDVEALLKAASPNGDTEFLGAGWFSMTVKAGEKAFKFGTENREESRYKVPYHPRLARPIIRKREVSKREDYCLNIEVQDVLDTETEITDEELLQVYKELREAGIKWCDVKKENLGRLKKPNGGYDGYNVPLPNSHLGIKDSGIDYRILEPGELVVLDLDFVYMADNPMAVLNTNAPQIIKEYEAEFQRREKEAKEQELKGKIKVLKKETKPDDGYGEI